MEIISKNYLSPFVTYSDVQYSAKDVLEKYGLDPCVHDLSRAKTWEEFITLQNYCTMKQYAALETGGRLAILMGDIKKKGRLYSQLLEIVKPGTIENIVIKEQFNCWSDRNSYNGKFIPICHEYLLILRKDSPLIVPYQITLQKETDIRDMNSSTWKQILLEVMECKQKAMTLNEIYQEVEPYKRTKKNAFWKEKIRQTLQIHDEFVSCSRGIWELAS